MATATTLSAADVSVRFGGVAALTSVSLDAHSGEVLGLIGPNGAGKTTLFDVLSGIRPPTSGRILYEGDDITKRSPTWRSRHGIRRTFQRQQMFGWLTRRGQRPGRARVARRRWRARRGSRRDADPAQARAERRARTDEVLELCGLLELRDQPAGKLPIGRARMVEMARAIVDEPRCSCSTNQRQVWRSATRSLGESMQRVCKERGCAVILVEHDVGFVMKHCDRIIVLNLGGVLAVGPPDVIRDDTAVQEAYLG